MEVINFYTQKIVGISILTQVNFFPPQNMMPESIQQMFGRKLVSRGKYSPELRSFALTLHFYSPKAYKFVRKTWDNLLPAISTLKEWYRVVDGEPGFTEEALHAIGLRASDPSKPVIINLTLDEISIREQLIYSGNRFHGGIDLGTGLSGGEDSDNIIKAKNALVFMAVSQTENWKIPIGYFLIDSLNGEERANLLTLAFENLHKVNCKVFSITFDGASANLSMCTSLGANFKYNENFKPYFQNPITQEPVYIFWDLCHMVKLVRNTLGDKGTLKTETNEEIKWTYLEELQKLQTTEGLRAANKLTSKHIKFQNNRMNVRLAMQTLSRSNHDSFIFLMNFDDNEIKKKFQDSFATAKFCLNFNNMADILNCKNRFSKEEFNRALTSESFDTLKKHAENFEKYISTLKTADGTPILQSQRKTGFLGIIICLRNIFPLFEQFKKMGMSYLLTFKLSQDFLETFFSAIRSKGGFNNNPNVLQFKSSYKRLLVRHEIKEIEGGNCQFDNIEILHASSRSKKNVCPIQDPEVEIEPSLFDHDYIQSWWNLSSFTEKVVEYIAGFVVFKIRKVVDCNVCKGLLIGGDMPQLSDIKNRGPYLPPAEDVRDICKMTESKIRQYSNQFGKKISSSF